MYSFSYDAIDSFKEKAYVMTHQCACGGAFEINVEESIIKIDYITLKFQDLHIFVCLKCGAYYLPHNTSHLVASAYSQAIEQNQMSVEFWRKDYRERFDYCVEHDFLYDHYDYYNIPGLAFDEEHSQPGFLTPVFFDKKVLQQFMLDDDYRVHLGAETYGEFRNEAEWSVPFGINLNGKVVFWLGDLSYMDDVTLARIKPYNVDSDHKLISSEFYAGQMCCIWAQPNREYRIYEQRNKLYFLLKSKFNIDLDHLPEETKQQISQYDKPLIASSKTLPSTVGVLHQVLIESVNISEMQKLYCTLLSPNTQNYKEMKSIKLYEGLLQTIVKSQDQVKEIIAPLYLLNDLRIVYDHLLPQDERNKRKANVENSLGITTFDESRIYDVLLNRLSAFFEYFIIGFSESS